jgi:hypothetical protein
MKFCDPQKKAKYDHGHQALMVQEVLAVVAVKVYEYG